MLAGGDFQMMVVSVESILLFPPLNWMLLLSRGVGHNFQQDTSSRMGS